MRKEGGRGSSGLVAIEEAREHIEIQQELCFVRWDFLDIFTTLSSVPEVRNTLCGMMQAVYLHNTVVGVEDSKYAARDSWCWIASRH